EITGGKHGIQVGSRWNHDLDNGKYPSPVDALTCDDITIQDNIVHDVSREGIKLPAGVRNIVITGNEIYNTGIQGATNAECIDAVGVIGLRVAGNFLHDCASNGIYAKGGSRNVIIENNLVMNVARNTGNGGGIYLGFTTTDYQLFDLPSNPDLYENLDSIVRNNIVVGIKGAGIGLQSTRSEEHTSELQSREKLVCRLLREKKKERREVRRRQCRSTSLGQYLAARGVGHRPGSRWSRLDSGLDVGQSLCRARGARPQMSPQH